MNIVQLTVCECHLYYWSYICM